MAKYRNIADSKIAVEAIQFRPHHFPWPKAIQGSWTNPLAEDESWGYVETIEGRKHIQAGDWIVTDSTGSIRLYKPALFETTFQPDLEPGMNRENIEDFMQTLDGMITAFDQAIVLGGRNEKEDQACELLKEARLKLIEDLEERGNY